jgi:hypothetical protein
MGLSLGEHGSEQFTVETRVDGKQIRLQEVHDPFAHTTVKLKGWRHAWNALVHGITINVNIGGTHGAMRAVMTLDPEKLQQDTEEHLREMANRRAENTAAGVVGYYVDEI